MMSSIFTSSTFESEKFASTLLIHMGLLKVIDIFDSLNKNNNIISY